MILPQEYYILSQELLEKYTEYVLSQPFALVRGMIVTEKSIPKLIENFMESRMEITKTEKEALDVQIRQAEEREIGL